MRVATLQFSPRVGEIAANFSRAESLLMRQEREGELTNLDLLVLPELAFTGYNFPTPASIAPFLEPTGSGPSTRWAARTAKRLRCTVAVGYPEAADVEGGNYNTIYDSKILASSNTVAYNSLVFVNCQGDVVAHHRKAFLYYSDEIWAQEGPAGFYKGVLPVGNSGQQYKVAAGICMDINPYKFESPWTAFEFANHAREARAKIVVVSMAWLTRLSHEDTQGDLAMQPDEETKSYWIERFRPLMGPHGPEEEVIIVCANRAGEEGTAERIGEVRYAGSSCVFGFRKADSSGQAQVKIWDMMGRAQEGVLVVDTQDTPKYHVQRSVLEVPAHWMSEAQVEQMRDMASGAASDESSVRSIST